MVKWWRFYNTKETYLLAQRQGVEMPITEQIYQMLFCGKVHKKSQAYWVVNEKANKEKNDVKYSNTFAKSKRISRMRTNAHDFSIPPF